MRHTHKPYPRTSRADLVIRQVAIPRLNQLLAILLGAVLIGVSLVALSAAPSQASRTQVGSAFEERSPVSVEASQDCDPLTTPEEAEAAVSCEPTGEDGSAGFLEDLVAMVFSLFGGSGEQSVSVPVVSRLPESDALAVLDEAGLLAGERSEAFDITMPAGFVISQDPKTGVSVASGSTVAYTVSKGPAIVVVPPVRDMAAADAYALLEQAGLEVLEVQRQNDLEVVVGAAVGTDPTEGSEVAQRSGVVLITSSGPGLVTVPDVRGRRAAIAVARLERAGIGIARIQNQTNADIGTGDTIRTRPAAGSLVRDGSDVVLHVSRGPAPILVPELVGLSRNAARATLVADGLVVGRVAIAEDPAPRNTVLRLDPPTGMEVAMGSAVALRVSSGPPTTSVPEVRGRAAADAYDSLERADLVVSAVRTRTNATLEPGTAVKTDPDPASEVDMGSSVVLTVSRGRKDQDVPDIVTIPAVARLPAADAVAQLAATGLSISSIQARTHAGIAAGQAIRTQPGAGAEVAFASEVVLLVSEGPKSGLVQVQIPNVRGRRAAGAYDRLERAGLVIGSIENRTNANIPAGVAIRTEPGGGRSVISGSPVTLFVSRGPAPVLVPDLRGLRRGAARSELTAADLVVGGTTFLVSTEPNNTILTQDPPAGVELPPGSPVHVTVSAGPTGSESRPETTSRRALEDDLLIRLSPISCVRWREADEPFDYGAAAAVLCEEPDPGVSQLALFSFPDSRSLDRFWVQRIDDLGLDSIGRPGVCRQGRQGVAPWVHGQVACYVPDTGSRVAKIRWTDRRTDTYGVIDAIDRDLDSLYGAWLSHRSR